MRQLPYFSFEYYCASLSRYEAAIKIYEKQSDHLNLGQTLFHIAYIDRVFYQEFDDIEMLDAAYDVILKTNMGILRYPFGKT